MIKIEVIAWHDAGKDTGKDCDWKATEDLEDEDIVVKSVGFVVRETDKYVTLAMDYIEADDSSNDRSRIPKGMIISRKIIEM